MYKKEWRIAVKEFVKLSKYAGMREDLVQAGGGNSAYKLSDDRMVIKASGSQLADVTEESGFAIVNYAIIRDAFLEVKNIDGMTDVESKKILEEAYVEGARPSIETFLHSISGRYSLHTHPIVVNALTCRKDGMEIIMSLFPDALVVPYATPGVELAKAYFKEYKSYKARHENEPSYVFLMNHGFMASADTADGVIQLTEKAVKKIEEYLGVDYSAYRYIEDINKMYPNGVTWLVTDQNVVKALENFGGTWEHGFCPDCVVFLGKKMYNATSLDQEAFCTFVENNGYPIVIQYDSNLYIHADSVKKALETQSVLSFSAQVMAINKGIECNMLDEKEKNFLLNWDAEKYRRNMK